MSIDPNTLPEGAVVEAGGMIRHLNGVYNPSEWGHEVTRVFVPAPEGMTYADAVTALADAGAWVEVPDFPDVPMNARYRYERRKGLSEPKRYLVHRDDLPPTDPDAELIEAMARAAHVASPGVASWEDREEFVREEYRIVARATLAALREHEATR